MLEVEVHRFADDPLVARDGRADEIRRQHQPGIAARYPSTRGKRISNASRSGRTALTWMISRGGCGGATTGFAVKSKGMPSTSAYSTLNLLSAFSSYDSRRSARPMTCSQRSWV